MVCLSNSKISYKPQTFILENNETSWLIIYLIGGLKYKG